ncbi:hypothetical protein Tco_0561840 [Tanacetum coccineum]
MFTRQNEYIKQKNVVSEASQIQEVDRRKAYSSSSQETRMKNWEDNTSSISGRVDDRREERHQRVDHLTALTESRIKSKQASQIYDSRINKTENTLVSKRQSDIRSEKQERNLESKMKSWEDDLRQSLNLSKKPWRWWRIETGKTVDRGCRPRVEVAGGGGCEGLEGFLKWKW